MNFKPERHYSFVILALFGVLASLMAVPSVANAETCHGKQLVVLGDSLTAGYGLKPGAAYPEKLGEVLQIQGKSLEVVNAGVSGDTTSGGLSRLDWSVGENAAAVIVELGGNDALRGIPVQKTRENLETIITRLSERGISVMLAGMLAPPNLGEPYTREFAMIYADLAKMHDVIYYPFFLDGVAAIPELNQDDGFHPNEAGIDVMVEKSLPSVLGLIERACGVNKT